MEVLIKLIQRDDIVKRNLSVNILYNLICRNYQNKGKIFIFLYLIKLFNNLFEYQILKYFFNTF